MLYADFREFHFYALECIRTGKRPRPNGPGLDEVSAVKKGRQAELGSFYP